MHRTAIDPKKEPGGSIRWGAEQRLHFIDYRLLWDGRINRADLVSFFKISVPQASIDLHRYLQEAPNNAYYDKTLKAYVATHQFSPLYAKKDADSFLNELLALDLHVAEQSMSFVGMIPQFCVVHHPLRRVHVDTLRTILVGLRSRRRLKISYQSMGREEPTRRDISPHALAYDGFRWHVRAFCHERHEFRDFLFPRILSFHSDEPSDIEPSEDILWHSFVTIRIAANPAKPSSQRKIIELDYEMRNGEGKLEVRAALCFYLLRHLGFDQSGRALDPNNQQIVILNWDEVAQCFTKGTVRDSVVK